MSERSGYTGSGDGQIHLSWHGAGAARAACLMLPPYGEERKCAYRLLVSLARRLAERGVATLRMDFRGTGESTGSLGELSLEAWREDARQALRALRELAPELPVTVLGARLGGLLATELAATAEAVRGLVLLEPVPAGGELVQELLRRKQVKEMMGGGRASSDAEDVEAVWARGGVLDADGFAMGAAFAAELREAELLPALARLRVPTRIVHISGAKRLTGRWAEIGEHCDSQAHLTLVTVREKPFWGRTDHHESEAIGDEVAAFFAAADS